MFYHTNDVFLNVRIIIYQVSGRLQMGLTKQGCIWQLKTLKKKVSWNKLFVHSYNTASVGQRESRPLGYSAG
jgi:hypothetical protein